ncbi:unnamed protein product [Nesidiocoris tenuis]|uniref:Uncharacterized protein n=1 Tax=Nesidiocoris tenuis TaxID=355587 RepID=A0A6H5H8G8_9HEMI|nr:unnamed protein product [Nesidiocoris tenuis]
MGVKDSWLHNMETYKSNLEWLLGLSHHEFWSQIVYGSDTWDSVISFLQEGYPFYSIDHLPDDEHITLVYSQIYYLVFNVFKRAMTRKESEVGKFHRKEVRQLAVQLHDHISADDDRHLCHVRPPFPRRIDRDDRQCFHGPTPLCQRFGK